MSQGLPLWSSADQGGDPVQRWVEQAELRQSTGMVVPAYFSASPSDDTVRSLLWVTLGDCRFYASPENVWVVVDGDARTARLVEELRDRLLGDQGSAFNMLVLPENHGKLWAIQEGVRALLAARPSVGYVVIRDCDGDHALSDVPGLVRAAIHLSEARGDSRVILIGARRSRHRPMGWVRGELERLLDRVTLDALAYALARQGRALDLSDCWNKDGPPDLSSGYKVYGRQIAQALFVEHEPHLACLSPRAYWHYGPETVSIVEGILGGATIGEAQRLTWDGQPTTSFGEFDQISFHGELLAWVYCRLELPLAVAAQFYDNCVPGMALGTTAQGREILFALRRHALERTQAHRNESGPLPAARPTLPFL